MSQKQDIVLFMRKKYLRILDVLMGTLKLNKKEQSFMEIKFNVYTISDDKERLDLKTIKAFLARSYWANKRSEERT
jgi:hypothetical protein